jgi:hypothetical protein
MRKWQWRHTIQSVPLLQEVIRYVVKQYFYRIGKNCIIEDIYLHHQDDVLHPLVTLKHFIGLVVLALVIPALVGPTRQGTGGRMALLGIGPMVHHPVAQSMPTMKGSIID